MAWTIVKETNCWEGHGANGLEAEAFGAAPGVTSLSECQTACLLLPGCNAILLTKATEWKPAACYRKDLVSIGECATDSSIDLYTLPGSPALPAPPPRPSPPLPPRPPPWTPYLLRTPSQVASALNQRFADGLDGSEPAPGVLVHVFDGFVRTLDEPWLIGSNGGVPADRISASLVNSRIRRLFSGNQAAGFVLSYEHNSILCAWAVDAGTMSRNCNPPGPSASCTPGCSGGEKWCEVEPTNYCPWGKGHLRDMVQQHEWLGAHNYNEVIIDARVFEQSTPFSIEAVVSFGGGGADEARRVQRLLVEHFDLPSGVIPLLRADLEGGNAPFAVVPDESEWASDEHSDAT